MKANSNQHIQYAFGDTQLGLVAVAQTDSGVCAVLFGASRQELVEDLQARFKKAILHFNEIELKANLASVVDRVNNPENEVSDDNPIPLDIQGTAFQQKVWAALVGIESGSTASYTQVAVSIGQPTAARAVATACAANPLAVLVPCHRVVRGDGGLSGYRWGVERKRWLLEVEGR